jgi:hypothetical protein
MTATTGTGQILPVEDIVRLFNSHIVHLEAERMPPRQPPARQPVPTVQPLAPSRALTQRA